MTRLEQATKRLERAVDRLERAVERARPAAGETEGGGQLQAELAKARKEHSDLKAVTRDVSERLDNVISRLRNVAES